MTWIYRKCRVEKLYEAATEKQRFKPPCPAGGFFVLEIHAAWCYINKS